MFSFMWYRSVPFRKLLFPKAPQILEQKSVSWLTDSKQWKYTARFQLFFPLRNKHEGLMSMKTTTNQCKRQHEWHVKTGRLPKQITSKRQTSFRSFQLFTWQGIKHSSHQWSRTVLLSTAAGNLWVFICTCDCSTWTEICFPWLLSVGCVLSRHSGRFHRGDHRCKSSIQSGCFLLLSAVPIPPDGCSQQTAARK